MYNIGAEIAVRQFANRVLALDGIPQEVWPKIHNICGDLVDRIKTGERIDHVEVVHARRARQ